jgi:diguanylate cyclase (GGDEF)-like protein
MANTAHQMFLDTQDIEGQIRANRVLGYLYHQYGKLDESLRCTFKGLELLKDNCCIIKEGVCFIDFFLLNNIGDIYINIGRYDEAMSFFHQALKYAEESGGPPLAFVLSNMAETCLKNDDLKLSLYYNKRVLKETQKQNMGYLVLHMCHLNFGLIFKKMGQPKKALKSFQEALNAAIKNNDTYSEVSSLIELGKLYLLLNDPAKAMKSLNTALEFAEEIMSNILLKDIHYVLAEVYDTSRNYKEALDHYKKHMAISKEVASKELEQRLNNYAADLKAEQSKKDTEIFRLKNIELKQKSEEIEQKARELEESYRNITVISEIGQKITASLDIKKVLNVIYKNINKLMDASVFGIGLYDESTGIIDYKMYIEKSKKLPLFQSSIDNEKSYASMCIKSKKEVMLDHIVADKESIIPGVDGTIEGDIPQSLIYYPLILADKVIGTITVQSYNVDAYTARNLETIKALASYIAIALNNSQKSEELKLTAKELELASNTDYLTGLYNRRYIIEKVEEEYVRQQRSSNKYSIIISDIDFFKKVNDTYGHDCGDYILTSIAKLLKSLLRKQDYIARWGGEEFFILLPNTDTNGAMVLTERMRKSIQDKKFIYNQIMISITMTFGISEYNDALKLDDTIKKADNALYEGKRKGRNCVIVEK